MAEISVSIKKLAAYCLDYAKLTTSAFLARPVKSPNISQKTLNIERVLIGSAPAQDERTEALSLDLLLILDHDPAMEESAKTDEQKEQEKRYNKDLALAASLDDINRKYVTSSYTKQVVIQTGFVSFKAKKILDGDEHEEVKAPLISFPIAITTKDHKNTREYQFEVKDDAVTFIINSLSKYLPQAAYDEIFGFVAKAEGEGRNTIPLHAEFFDELWAKIVFNLRKVDAQDISEKPDLSCSIVTLVQRSNYFLSQDLLQMIGLEDEELEETSLSAWSSDEDMSLSSEVEDDGSNSLFFPFPYDKHQLNVLGVIDNRAVIVEGPPGTGKSQTISNLLVHLAAEGKKVLFVSQKDQAVRGVKEKLKSLDVPFLFGYIPDRLSPLHTEEDEQDSAANTLVALNRQWSLANDTDPIAPLQLLNAKRQQYTYGIDSERSLFELYERRRKLDYVSEFSDKPISAEVWHGLVTARDTIRSDRELLKEYAVRHKEYIAVKDKAYAHLRVTLNDVVAILRETERIFKETVPERPGLFSKPLKRMQLKQSVRRTTNTLPTEIWRDIVVVLDSNDTKTERLISLEQLTSYFDYHQRLLALQEATRSLEKTLEKTGLSQRQVAQLEELLKSAGEDQVFTDIAEYAKLSEQIAHIERFSANELRGQIADIKKYYKSNVVDYVRNRILRRVDELGSNRSNKAILARVARSLTKSKRAYKTFDKLKSDSDNFAVMSEVLPIWMMSLDDASRILPMEKNRFDYVIIDEASQCNIAYALPVMFRTKHTVFFGDSLQMRDTNTLFKTNEQLDALGKKHGISEHYQIKADEDSVKSVMDIASLSGFKTVTLRSHYRSPKELIGFSNENFYEKVGRSLEIVNDNIFTYKNTNRVLINHIIDSNPAIEESDQTSMTEALYISSLISDLKKDSAYKDKSIAVLTFFNGQAELLRKVITDEDIKISTIEGIQGDERDVIIYSFVITSPEAKRRYIALSGEGGEIRKGPNEGRVNVAFSRARLQVHAVTSLAPELWPEGIWIKRYLDYVDQHGTVSTRHESAIQQFDSKFEEDVFNFLSRELDPDKFYLTTQVKSCGFKIDLVVTDKQTNKKLAIECDGPTHFEAGDGQVYVVNDFERQSVLEVAGWDFYRISYFDWQSESHNEGKALLEYVRDYFKHKPHVEDVMLKVPQGLEPVQPAVAPAPVTITQPEPAQSIKQQKLVIKKTATPVPTNNGATFKEIGRIKISGQSALVLSLYGSDGLIINEYVNTPKYTGFTKKNVMIGTDYIPHLATSLNAAIGGATMKTEWYPGARQPAELHIRPIDDKIDVRQWLTEGAYTGYTLKGFRIDKSIAMRLAEELSKLHG